MSKKLFIFLVASLIIFFGLSQAQAVEFKGNGVWDPTTGNVGIGTTAPNNRLDITTTSNSLGISFNNKVALSGYDSWLRLNANGQWGNTYTPKGLRADGGLATPDYSLVAGEVRANIFRGGNTGYYLNPASTSNLNAANFAGNVGIGTTAPGAKLQVNGNEKIYGNGIMSATNGNLILYHPSSDSYSSIIFPSRVNYGSDYGYITYYDDNNSYDYWGNSAENSALVIGTQNDPMNSDSDVVALRGAAADVFGTLHYPSTMIVNDDARVGIGTTAPAARLDVNGSFKSTSATITGLSGSGSVSVYSDNNGNLYTGPAVSSVLSGSGATNYVAKWSGTHGLTKSQIYDNGTNVGIGITNPSSILDVNGVISGKYRGQYNSASVTAGNWYRIASNPGNRANAEFTLRDFISGGGHSTLTFRAGTSYNYRSGMSFTVLDHSYYGTPTFTKVRILTNSTYATQYLEVYVARTGSVDYSIYDNLQSSGWTPIDWIIGSVPSGYTINEYNVNNLFVVGNYQNKFTIARSGNVGIGTTAPGTKLDVNGSFKSTSGTITGLSGSGSVSVYSDNNGNLYTGPAVSSVLSGSGATNYVAKWSGTHGLTKSQIYDNGTNVGIGITNPTKKLYVSGDSYTSQIAYAGASMRAPIFYDSNNTGYYLNPASTSHINVLTTAGAITATGVIQSNSSVRAPIFYDSNNTGYYLNPASTSKINIMQVNGYLLRGAASKGYLAGSYNNIGPNDTKSDPIYTIGTSYAPSDTALGNMYGIGYSHANFWKTTSVGTSSGTSGWGLYVAADGDIREILDASTGIIWSSGSVRSPIFYDSNNTSYYLNPASTSNLNAANFAGNVGIGTTNPTKKLYVSGDSYTSQIAYAGASMRAPIFYDSNNTGYYLNPASTSHINVLTTAGAITATGVIQSNSSVRAPIFYDSNNTGYYLNPASTSNLNAANFAGKVGIGTTAPGAKLDVNGGLITTFANYLNGYSVNSGNSSVIIGNSIGETYALTAGIPNVTQSGFSINKVSSYSYGASIQYATPVFVVNNSNVGIGISTPTTKLYVNGNITANGFIYSSSDRTLKKNIVDLKDSLAKIEKLQGVSFNWKKNNEPGIGLIAQDVQKVYPRLVNGKSGHMSLNYTGLVAPLIEAVKTQQKEIESLQLRVKVLEAKVAN